MPADFADYALIEDAQPATPIKDFVPAGGKQKNKNKEKAKNQSFAQSNVTKEPTPDVTKNVDHIPISTPASQSADLGSNINPNELQSIDAVATLIDVVPDMFNDSARVYEAVRAVLPVKPALAMVMVSCIPLLACYLISRRQD